MQNDKEILTVNEFANLVSISRTNVYNLVHSPGFPAFRPTKNTIRIFKDDAILWLRKNQPI